jgi:hypothetical protein
MRGGGGSLVVVECVGFGASCRRDQASRENTHDEAARYVIVAAAAVCVVVIYLKAPQKNM